MLVVFVVTKGKGYLWWQSMEIQGERVRGQARVGRSRRMQWGAGAPVPRELRGRRIGSCTLGKALISINF